MASQNFSGTTGGNSCSEDSKVMASPPKIFVLDDDPIFCRLMQKTGAEKGVKVSICSSLSDLGTDPSHANFDVAIIDYYIEEMTGTDIACLVQQRPVILVSRSEDWMQSDRVWPECIRKFVSKKDGVIAILEAALDAAEIKTETPKDLI